MNKRLSLVLLLTIVASFLVALGARAGTIAGSLQTPTSGTINNGTLTFTLSQAAIVSGTASVVPTAVSCYTSNSGTVVGVPDPVLAPGLSTNTGSGTLAAATYFVKITYYNATGESNPSPEAVVTLGATGTVIVTAPVLQPSAATGYKVYISSTTGTETLQSTVTGFGNYSQASALISGAALPVTNASACSIRFSDELIPSGTYYTVSLSNSNGSRLAGYPQTWCTYGGSGGTINVSNGAPSGNCGTIGVFYPTPILATPNGGAVQSIGGPLNVTGAISASSVKAGTSGSTISDTRELVQSVHNCGSTTTCANTPNNSYREVLGAVTLSTGTATVSGISPAFTSTNTFGCMAMDQSSAAPAKIVAASGSSFTVTGTGSDQIFYVCIGN